MVAKLRKWEHLDERKCLNCNKLFVAKIYVAQVGVLKGNWMISSCYCSTKCSKKHRKMIEEVSIGE